MTSLALLHLSSDPEVAILAPFRAPRILHDPKRSQSTVFTVADQEHGMINFITAQVGKENALAIEAEVGVF